MDEASNDNKYGDGDDLRAFRLSAEHLAQLIEFVREQNDERLSNAVERAIKAHVTIARALVNGGDAPKATAPETERLVSEGGKGQGADATESADAWVKSPWDYLKISSAPAGSLGPMPRFVPLPQPDQDED